MLKGLIPLLMLSILAQNQHALAGGFSCRKELSRCRSEAKAEWKECMAGCDQKNATQCRAVCTEDRNVAYSNCDDLGEDCVDFDAYSPPEKGTLATSCVTNFGACPMATRIPIGTSCFCPTPNGVITGIAR
jgi:hypothetical protein